MGWCVHHISLLFTLFMLISVVYCLDRQNNITFEVPQANQLWNNSIILGNGTVFQYPLDLGTGEFLLFNIVFVTSTGCNGLFFHM